ncbi:unnamed protein product, partial [Mesorhabditis spiculigera]
MGFETPEEGCLANIMIQEGTKDAPMGNLLCIIVESKDEVAALPTTSQRRAPLLPPRRLPSKKDKQPKQAEPAKPQVQSVSSSGHGGRILAADLSSASPAPADGTPQQPASAIGGSGNSTKNTLSNMRMTIAKRLAESKSTILHYYSSSEINIDNVLQVREKLNKLLAKGAVGRRAHQALHQRFYHQGHHHHLIVVVVHLTGIEDVSSCKNQKKAANEVNSDVMKMTIWS